MPRYLILFINLLLLSACSGDDLLSADPQPQTPQPVISVAAIDDYSINESSNAPLNATVTGQTTDLTFAWTVSPTITINHPDTALADASFVAPQTTEPVSYRFTITVTDAEGNVASDQVTVEVLPVNANPQAVIGFNQMAGYAARQFPAGAAVVLNGSDSHDADSPAGQEQIASWRWQQTSGVNVLQGVSLDGETLSFIAPVRDPASQLVFSLTVTDQEGGIDNAEIVLSVLAASDTLPEVDAGVDVTVVSGEAILLAGQASSVNSGALPLEYLWLNDSTLAPAIDSHQQLVTYAVAPKVQTATVATFTLQVDDALGHSVEDSVDVLINPRQIVHRNDTGVVLRANGTTNISSIQSDYPGQDADTGRDSAATHGLLEKAGRGENGFDFTRLDQIGDEVDDVSQPWRCVRDNVTGLVWEIKHQGIGFSNNSYSYSWYQQENNGGIEGDLNGAGATCNMAQCNTSAYVAAINGVGLCGFYDWRLPTHNELLSILHLGRSSAPLIDNTYFPFTTSGLAAPVWYWSSEPSADGVSSGEAQNAWAIDFASGNDNFLNKSVPARVRLVRAGR
ncbi:DUF1566 domain-containing protein [Neptunicella sp. SCSIO 80796]|uniref:Lcl C-terminal domain-containing protein n=1 Tax=Neptunicella plasticusilytica TaxID=3117012 RepID=UPI003A4D5769